MQRKLDESKNIINYLKFQRIPFNKDLPKVLESYIFNRNNFNNLKKHMKDLITPSIDKQIEIFEDICQKYNINYLNYVLILESLPNDKIKNLFRYFLWRWTYLLNTDENFINDKKTLKFKYSYNNIYSSSTPKRLLLETLEDLKKKMKLQLFILLDV
jgi:hypothetical protein